MRFILKTIGATLLALLLLVVAIVAFFDWNAMRPEIEQRLSATLGRDVRIEGPLDVRLGLRPHVVANQVRVANAPWGRAPALLEAERVDASLRLWPLFHGRLEVVEAGIEGGTLALEQNEAGEQNWDFLPEREEDDAPPGFERLDMADVAVSFDDHARDGVIRGGLERLAIETEEEAGPLAVSGTGQLEQRPFSVDLDLGAEERTPAAQEERFPISGTVRYGHQTIQLNGRTGPRRQLVGGGIELQAKGDNLHADLAPFGIDIGPLPPYEATAVLEVQEDGRYRVHELRMLVGQTQLAAEGSVSLEPPAARGAVHVARLHLPDLEGVIAETDPDAPGFFEAPLPVDLLRRAAVSLDVRIDAITGAHERLEEFGGGALAVELQGGVLRVPPFAMALGKTKLQGEATLDANAKVPAIEAALSFGGQSVRVEGRTGPEGIPARGRYAISAQGRGLHADLAALGIETAPLPPYKASAVAQLEPHGVQLDKIAARFGESQLSGKAFVGTDPLAVRANLHVPRLHLQDFAFDQKKEGAKEKPKEQATNPLQTALPVEWLREGRLALDLRIDEITGGLDLLGQARLAAELKEGVLRVSPLRSAVNGTSLEVHATLDATVERPTIDARLSYGAHQVQLKGRTGPQARLAGGSLRVFAKGKDPLPPYEASAVLQVGEEEVRLQKLAASLGESQLAGSATVSLEPPALHADLAVSRLHIPDLQALRTQEADETGEPGLLDRPLPVDLLRRARAVVDVRVERITDGEILGALLDSARLSVAMEDGVLQVSPLAAEASQGTLEAYATLDATVDPPTVSTKVSFTGVHLEEVLDEVKDQRKPQDEDGAPILEQITGSLGGSAELSAAGRSPREMLANLNGSFGVAMEGGTMSYVADRLAALDLAGVAKWLAGDDEPIELQCMISLFDVEQGVARPSIMLLASEDTDIWGDGEINLREGTVGLELEAEPREARVGVLRSPIRIEGDLGSPSVGPAPGPLAARGATAAILGVVAAPVAALLGTLTTGPGEETVCKDYWSAISQVHEGTLPEKK
jgi:uncharacterized protein involved in outer membrane biogenesis